MENTQASRHGIGRMTAAPSIQSAHLKAAGYAAKIAMRTEVREQEPAALFL